MAAVCSHPAEPSVSGRVGSPASSADLAQNTLGWQWTAGCGADAAPFFRVFNPRSQGEKFDPNGDYIRRWCPELAKLPTEYIHAPDKAPAEILTRAGVKLGVNYPEPVVCHAIAREVALDAYVKLRKRKGERQDDKGKEVKKDSTVGESYKDQFEQAKKVLEKCKQDVKCYLDEASSDENQTKEKAFTAMKAFYMYAIYGKEADRDALIDVLPKLSNPEVRLAGLKALEALTPKNGAAAADKLQGFVDKAEENKETDKVQEFQIFLQTAARLRARSQ